MIKSRKLSKLHVELDASDIKELAENIFDMIVDKVQKKNITSRDSIFLLSQDEYEKYKDRIPKCNSYWWLRTPDYYSSNASCVNDFGNVYYYGIYVYINYGVRPALKSNIFKEVGKKYSVNTYSFTCIDEGLGIATVPISFDMFDSKSNDYETSYIRRWLLEWLKEGEKDKGYK